MKILPCITKRYSVRSYLPKPVENEKLKAVLEAARLAPSAKNFQEWRFVVVQDAETRKKLMVAANNQSFVGEAPVVIACSAVNTNYVMRGGQLTYPIDVAIAVDHMTLQAVEEGLGSCWIGSFYEEQVKKILGIPEQARVVALLTLGYPADKQPERRRKAIDQITCYEKWDFSE
jgi:nitroreductase